MSQQIRAKFTCNSVTEHADGAKNVMLTPVTTGSEENKSFAAYTPGGKLEMVISPGTQAADYFKPGKQYYLDITEAE